MTFKTTFLFVLFMGIASMYAQNLALVRDNGLFGYINTSGEFEIRPRFKQAKSFSEGYAAVLERNKWGLIDSLGKWVLKPEYDRVKNYNSGYVLVLKNDQWNYINTSGEILNTPVTEKFYDFNNGVAFFRKDKKIGLLGTDGKLILNPTYDVIKPFVNGFAKVRKEDFWGMIDLNGRVFIPTEYLELGAYNEKGVWAKKGETFGIIINNKFNAVKDIDKIWDFNNNSPLTYARSNKKIGFINNKGEWIIKPIYDKARAFNNGLAPVFKKGFWGYIDEKGSEVIAFSFKDAELFSENGLAPVKEKKLWGFIDKSGNMVIPAKYQITAAGLSLFSQNPTKGFHNGFARVKLENQWGFINKKGKVLGGKWHQNAELFSNTK
jgi:hypothetical protein